ncbi:putative transporter [Campylobacter coli]
MFSSFFASKKWALWAYLGLFLLLFFLYMQTSLNVAINSWYSDFYNVLQKPKIELLDSNTTQKAEEKFENNASLIQEANQKAQENFQKANIINKGALYYYQSLLEYFFNSRAMIEKESYSASDFYALILVFLAIAIPYVLIATINIYFASVYAFKWREAMTFSYLKFWKNKDDNIEGSSQRIQEDTYNFSKIVESLGLSFIRALMTLVAFIPILWTLSDVVSKALFANLSENSSFYFLKNIDGLLVYVALLISLGGLIVSWFVGIKLPGLEYNNQKKELVYAEDNRKEYAKNETMIELFTGLKFNYKRLFLHYGYFNIWLILFEQMIVIVPFLIMAPGLFAGAIGLGIVMQINNAFDQVRSSFSVFITNWTTITQLRSIHKRLKEFEKNIEYAKNKNKNHL